jgi:mRNA interferase MazF
MREKPKPAIMRGDIHIADLDPVVGSEQGGRRPCLVVQNDMGNRHAPTVIVAPITSRMKPELPTHLPVSTVPASHKGSVALLEQLRTIDKRRLGAYRGSLGYVGMCMLDAALAASLDLRPKEQPPTVMTLCRTCKAQFEDAGLTARLLSDLNGPKDTCDFCNTRCGFDYEVRR